MGDTLGVVIARGLVIASEPHDAVTSWIESKDDSKAALAADAAEGVEGTGNSSSSVTHGWQSTCLAVSRQSGKIRNNRESMSIA